jgi:magnesium-protoporphyrin O-methyltransferase
MTALKASPPDRYLERRAWLEQYFDRTAATAWAALTTTADVSSVRARVRAGRERMRATLGGWLPEDLHGACSMRGAAPGSSAVTWPRAVRPSWQLTSRPP